MSADLAERGSGDVGRSQRTLGQRLCAAMLLVFIGAAGVAVASGSMEAALTDFGGWLAMHRQAGVLIYSFLFIVLFMLFVPTTPMEMLAGYVFGFWGSFALMLVLSPLAHAVTFLAARRVGIARVSAVLRDHLRIFRAIEMALKDDPAAAWQTVLLVTAAYLPAGPKVYGLAAIAAVRSYMVVVCAMICCVPHAVVNAWMGSSVKDLQAALSGSPDESPEERRVHLAMLVLNVFVLLVVTVAIARFGKRALEKLAKGGAGSASRVVLPADAEDAVVYLRAP